MRLTSFIVLIALSLGSQLRAATDAVLKKQTQELVDAITAGDASAWRRYLHERATITTEDGEVYTKAKMVEGIKPLAQGVSGSIVITDFKTIDHGTVAITNYLNDEHENYHGHKLHCQYRSTDTWLKMKDGWRLIAAQLIALRTDPPSIALAANLLDAYVGRYELTPEISYEIRKRADGQLEGQRTGRAAELLMAEAPDVLFVPGHPRYRRIFKRDEQGRITSMTERREAWDIDWKRLP
jgi:ketosteroid isomerase-like protein